MAFIFPYSKWKSWKSRGFRMVTRKPQTQISCFWAFFAMFWGALSILIMETKFYHSKFLHFWENRLFFRHKWETGQNYGHGTGPKLCDQTSHQKHVTTLNFLCLTSLTWLVLWGEIKKFGKNTLLHHCWIVQSMAYIFPELWNKLTNSNKMINFQLFLQNLCDFELLTQFPMKTPQKNFNLEPGPYL